MLASIIKYSENLPDEDILIFLNDGEIKELENNPLKGSIFEFRDVRNVYSLEIKVNERELETYKIKVERSPNKYLIVIGSENYQELKEKGWLGTRPDTFSKIDIMSVYVSNQDEESTKWLRNINFKWENRDRIIKKMEEREL